MPTSSRILEAVIILPALTVTIFYVYKTFFVLCYYSWTCSVWRREGLGRPNSSFMWKVEVIKEVELGS